MIRIATIAEADYRRALARVRIGDLTTDWRPWLASRAGGDSAWWAPEIGEQVILFSPSGELTLGVILSGLYGALHRPGVHNVILTSPVADIDVPPTSAAWCSAITIHIAAQRNE